MAETAAMVATPATPAMAATAEMAATAAMTGTVKAVMAVYLCDSLSLSPSISLSLPSPRPQASPGLGLGVLIPERGSPSAPGPPSKTKPVTYPERDISPQARAQSQAAAFN
jgi:hypothetical protein